MKTVSIKVTVTDDEFYDWFIEPHKINGELPNLVLRLLTAYANNSELAFQIDQFLDKDTEPEAFEVREAIMQAITQLNSLEATANQELEALSDTDTAPDEDEDDIIVTSGEVFTPETVARNIGSMIGLPDTSASAGTNFDSAELFDNTPIYDQPQTAFNNAPEPKTISTPAPVQTSNPEFETKMFSALDTLTTQIGTLTGAVSQLVAMNSQPMMIPMQAGMMYAQQGIPAMQMPVPMATPVQATPVAENQNMGTAETPTATAPQSTTPSNNAQNGSNLSVTGIGGETTPPTETTPLNRISDGFTTNQQIVENSVENVENSADDEDDGYSVPDFMADMIDSCM